MPWLSDVLLTGVVTAVALASLILRFPQVVETDDGTVRFATPDAVGVGLVLLGAVPLVWRRRHPWPVLLVTGAAAYALHALGYPPPTIAYGPMLALFSLATLQKPIRSLIAAGVTMLGTVVLYLTSHSPVTDDQFLTYLLSFGAAWGLGNGVQLSHTRADLLGQRAAQLALEQDTNARLAIEQERARIARELHDIVSDRVVVMVAQAAATRTALTGPQPDRPDPAPGPAPELVLGISALRSIEDTGRDALAQTRRLLGLLQPLPPDSQELAGRGLADLPHLVARWEAAGLAVAVVVQGIPGRLPPEVDALAYRIVSEALANTSKYASPAWAEVVVGYQPGWLGLGIHDLGTRPGPAIAAAGQGLAGILRRVVPLGGRMVVGPRPYGGFEVQVELPLDGAGP